MVAETNHPEQMNRYHFDEWLVFAFCALVLLGWCGLAGLWAWSQRNATPARNYGIEVVLEDDEDDFSGGCQKGVKP